MTNCGTPACVVAFSEQCLKNYTIWGSKKDVLQLSNSGSTDQIVGDGICKSLSATVHLGRKSLFSTPPTMSSVTRILSQIESGDPTAAEKLLPLVYEELRKLAAAKLAQEKPGQTLQATALVHDAYLRLVDNEKAQYWNGRGHFFAAAAEAMRRILVDRARQKRGPKRGGDRVRVSLEVACDVRDERSCWPSTKPWPH